MKNDKINISLMISIIAFIIAAFFFWNQSKQIVVKSEIPYTETGSSSYKVFLEENDYYDKKFLDEDMQYISTIIKNIEMEFTYKATYADIKDYQVIKDVFATVTITDTEDNDKIIYTKKEKLKEDRESLDELAIDDTIEVDYKKYNNLVNKMKTKYGISADCNLRIDYNITFMSSNGSISDAKKLYVDVPLSKQMITIKKSDAINNNGEFTIVDNNSILNTMMVMFTILMIVFTGIDIIILVVRITGKISRESKYDRFIKKALREYDSYITESKDEGFLPNKPIIRLNSFKELIDVRNNIDKTIIYTKISNDTSKFEIIDEVIYEYIVTRDDMEK